MSLSLQLSSCNKGSISHVRVLILLMFGTLWLLLIPASWAQSLVAAVLPSSRSVQVGTPATAFATIINTGASTAISCGITPITTLQASFVFQTTDPSTNKLTGTPNTPANIPAGQAQTFVFAFTPIAPFAPTDVRLSFDCANTDPAPITSGLTTLLLSASATPVPDIVALVATQTNDGIVHIPGDTMTGIFAVATVNVGAGGAMTVSTDTGGASLPATISLCETNPTTGVCLAAPTSGVSTQITANATPTFGIFVAGGGSIPFDAAVNRVLVSFRDTGGVTRGATTVAVRTLPIISSGTFQGSSKIVIESTQVTQDSLFGCKLQATIRNVTPNLISLALTYNAFDAGGNGIGFASIQQLQPATSTVIGASPFVTTSVVSIKSCSAIARIELDTKASIVCC